MHDHVRSLLETATWQDNREWLEGECNWRVPVHPGKVNVLTSGDFLCSGDLLRRVNDGQIAVRREKWPGEVLAPLAERMARQSPAYARVLTPTEAKKPVVLVQSSHRVGELAEGGSHSPDTGSERARQLRDGEIIDGARAFSA